MEPLQIEQFKEGLYGLRRGFSNRKQNVGNHWKHWVLGNLVDLVNTKYRKEHRPSSDEIVVNHQFTIDHQFLDLAMEFFHSTKNKQTLILHAHQQIRHCFS